MNKHKFLYKLLLAFKKNNIKTIDFNSFCHKYDILNSILDAYNLNEYIFESEEEFRQTFISVFLGFALGYYSKDGIITLNEEPSIEEIYYKFELEKISDKLMNEFAMILSFEINKDNDEKQLVRN